MKGVRLGASLVLVSIAVAAFSANVIAPAHYADQFRDQPDAKVSRQHLLGTDELGRDRLSRVLYGARVSFLLAPAAAMLSTVLAAVVGGVAGYAGGWVLTVIMSATDLFLSLPWLFLLITVRALVPLNTSPFVSVVVTFAILGCLGWAGAARIVCADTRQLCDSDFILLARASGASGLRLLYRHLLPNLKPVLLAQFWISVPVFILTEANLGMLGLGVSEPLPSLGSLLRELEGFTAVYSQPWVFAPFILLVLTVGCFHLVFERDKS